MKVSVLQENLSHGLSNVSRSVAARAQLPVLSNILLATDQGRLKLAATNLETGINLWVGAKIESQGAICIPAKSLTEYVAALPVEKVELEVKENTLHLQCAGYQASFVGLSASEFPNVPTLADKPEISFKASDLAAALAQVVFAAAQDEGRPVLTGVLFQVKNGELMLVATDGYRLSLKRLAGSTGTEKNTSLQKGLLIPGRTLLEVGKMIGDKQELVGLSITPEANQVIFTTPDCEISSRLIEGSFPEFEKILPDKGTTRATCDKENLIRAVRMAAIFARESANIIKFQVKSSKLQISANAAQVGENISELEVNQEGEGGSIAFNSRYLLDFLNSCQGDLVNFEMTTALNPGVFTSAADKTYTHIIMPVRVQE